MARNEIGLIRGIESPFESHADPHRCRASRIDIGFHPDMARHVHIGRESGLAGTRAGPDTDAQPVADRA